MKKNLLLSGLLSIMLLASCTDQPSNPSESVSPSVSSEVSQSTSEDEQFVKDDTIFDFDEFEIGVNDWYNFTTVCKEEYANSWIDYYFDDKEIAYMSADDAVYGKKEGTTKVKAVFDETTYDEFVLKVVGEDYMNENLKVDAGRLKNKKFVVFGDSISDVTVTAYPDNRPQFWCEQLVANYDMTMYNYAKSGSTAGYSHSLMAKGPYMGIVGTTMVQAPQAIEDIKNSDFAFIFFGGNDATYACNIGEIGDVDENNYDSKESFKGAYSFIIDRIRSYNPKIKIICLSLSSSSWGIENSKVPGTVYAKSRKELCEAVKDVAAAKKAKYIDIYGLWEGKIEGASFADCCPDGIHPQTKGYKLIIDAILNG